MAPNIMSLWLMYFVVCPLLLLIYQDGNRFSRWILDCNRLFDRYLNPIGVSNVKDLSDG